MVWMTRLWPSLLALARVVQPATILRWYMIGRRGPPSQSWRTFLRNHADAIAAIDLCVVPTLTFARRPNPGRGSTYRRGNSVQTTAATSR
jgi:hypothetical protein